MDFLKDIFGDKTLSFDEFSKAIEEKKIKLVDLTAGGYVSKEKFDAKLEELKATQETLKQKDEALKKWDGVDLDKMKADNIAETTKLNEKIAALQKQNAIDTALLSDNIQDLKAVKAYIDFDIVKVDDKGEISGLKEQIDKLKTEKTFLFKTESQVKTETQEKKLTTGISLDARPSVSSFTLKDAITDSMGLNKR